MSVINAIEKKYKKSHVVDVRSGDTVKVHQKIREGNKERVQVFEGLVIRTGRSKSHTSSITVRRIASGVGVEKTYLIHSPLITKVQVVKRSKVRRNYLSYMRARTGKAARLSSVDFDQEAVNKIPEPPKEEAKKEQADTEKPDDSQDDAQESKQDEKVEAQPSADKPSEGSEQKQAEKPSESAKDSKPENKDKKEEPASGPSDANANKSD